MALCLVAVVAAFLHLFVVAAISVGLGLLMAALSGLLGDGAVR